MMIDSILFVSLSIFMLSTHATKQETAPKRPSHVTEALQEGRPLYYFGLGSNMLRSKLENRAMDGKIDIIDMRPAFIPGYRLSFNLRGFPPLEPGMGALEPIESGSKAVMAYDKPECHGALVLLSPENYEKVMRSEGVSHNSTNAGYEEIVVEAYPYDSDKPVPAVALRARSHVRLNRDPCPSARYMKILREGAAELQLKPCYQEFLAKHPIHKVPKWLRQIAIWNLMTTFTISNKLKTRVFSQLQSWMLFRLYVPPTSPPILQGVSNVLMATILMPGAAMGVIIRVVYALTKKDLPPFLNRFLKLLKEAEQEQEGNENTKPQVNEKVTLD